MFSVIPIVIFVALRLLKSNALRLWTYSSVAFGGAGLVGTSSFAFSGVSMPGG